MNAQVPDKIFYKIGEVHSITRIEPYILRYWESEFGLLRPNKNKNGQRIYRKKDIELVNYIKKLLYEERLTIEGAKKRLLSEHKEKGLQMELNLNKGQHEKIIINVKEKLKLIRKRLKVIPK